MNFTPEVPLEPETGTREICYTRRHHSGEKLWSFIAVEKSRMYTEVERLFGNLGFRQMPKVVGGRDIGTSVNALTEFSPIIYLPFNLTKAADALKNGQLKENLSL